MFSFKNIVRGVFILLLCLGLGVTFSKIYQPEAKNIKVYKQALIDYNNENYSNAYFLYSKVSATSSLKAVALYRQAMCAKKLGDRQSELKTYQQLINYYPNSKFANEARYYAGQIIIDEDAGLAYRYFDRVSKSDMAEDYKVASEYYKARINANRIRYSSRKASDKKIKSVEDSFREYLVKYPDGRLAVSVANTWLKFNPNLSSEDYVLVARAYMLAKNDSKLNEVIDKPEEKDVWAVRASMLFNKRDVSGARALIFQWITQDNETVYRQDYNRAIDSYISLFDSDSKKYTTLSDLLDVSKGEKRDYIWNLKCSVSPNNERFDCYKDLYKAYPQGEYARIALFNAFEISLANRDYQKCRALANEYLQNYEDSKEAPMVMFWAAKIDSNKEFLNKIIKKYPDSYYAYRAFWLLKSVKGSTIATQLKLKPVVYPYKTPGKKSVLYALMQVKDYEMIKKYSGDKFIESWVEYEQGNYATSMIVAREAMSELEIKPEKTDLRWRLVYPQNYMKQVKKYAQSSQNNEALMLSILREESSFNPKAQSNVGAMGLMQLMPETAQEIASRNKIPLETLYLMNPEINIKLGNLYYADLKKALSNEVAAIAAYNGGIGAVTNWKNKLNYSDVDEFVVQIPYEETQYYIEKVFGSYWNYTRIYQ